MTSRRWLALLLVAGAVSLLVARELSQFYAGYRWYRAAGALSLWEARLSSLLLLRLAGGAALSVFAFANFYAVRQSVVSLVLPRRIGNLDIGEEVSSRALTSMALGLALIVAAALALSLTDWTGFLLARIGRPFGETDPYFAADLGFFVYRLPFEVTLFTWATASTLCVAAVVVFLYVLTPGLRWEQGRLHLSEYVRRHLAVLGGVIMLLLAWHFRLEMYGTLLDGTGPNGALTAVDHRVRIPGSLLLSMITFACGLIVVWAGGTGQRRLALTALLGALVAGVATRDVAPIVARRIFEDGPDAAARERPYEATRAGYTRRAYAVDRIVVSDSSAAFATLAEAAVGVPDWDARPLARAVESESRLGPGARVAWESRRDGLVGVIASPQPPPAPGQAAPVGIVVRTLASAADARGAPVRLPAAGSDDDALLLAPSIILDTASGYAVVPDSGGRVAGAPLTSPLERLAEALSVQNLRLWFQELPEPRPVLVTVRDARQRVAAVAPFFAQGSEVVPLVVGDSLTWAIDLYSASSTYPLSQRFVMAGKERSYFQHAATALVASSTGVVRLVADSVLDPLAATWVQAFPALFVRAGAVEPPLLGDLPPAIDGLRAQSLAFGRYGTRINSGAPGHPAVVDGADSMLAAQLPVFALPRGGPTALEIPLLDAAERVRGILVGEGGARHRTVWLANAGPLPSWQAVLDRLGAADSIARPANVTAVHGVVRAFALGRGVAFMQPTYRWTPGAVPALLHVAYLVNDTVRIAPTLRGAAGVVLPSTDSGPASRRTRQTMLALYQEMRDALRRGDWDAFGKAFDTLGALLSRPQP
ncbi:MAG TPA: UPF0182 family protein [Gemmatimonadaceae bacterium]|nr:UPF0182 family protein [Gemmatimonadaceae bacterium]